MKRVFRIQAQCKDGSWLKAPGTYHSIYEAEDAARTRCTLWRIVTGSGKVVKDGPQRPERRAS